MLKTLQVEKNIKLFKKAKIVPVPVGMHSYRCINLADVEYDQDMAQPESYPIRVMRWGALLPPHGEIPPILDEGAAVSVSRDGTRCWERTEEFVIEDRGINGLMDFYEEENESLAARASSTLYDFRESQKRNVAIKGLGFFSRVFCWNKSIRGIES